MTKLAPFIEPRKSDPRFAAPLRFKMLINGQSVDAASGETLARESPAYEGVIVSEIPNGSAADSERAILAARRAFDEGPWPRMSGADRAKRIARLGELITAHREELALIECLEVGKTLEQARNEMNHSAELWSYAAGHARGLEGESHNDFGAGALGLMLRQPIGVVGIVTPWNFPLLIGSERVPWAIGAGCCVVVKPSEFTSGSTIRMAELAREAGIPDGVINVVTGYGNPVGQLFAEHPACDMINFTGSFRVGQIVGGLAAARIKRVGLELGGKGPAIVFADANLDAAADTIARSIFGGQGQACISNSRMIVQRDIKDAMLERLVHIASNVTVGDPLDPRTKIGAMIHRPHLEKVEHYVSEGIRDGAGLVVGGRRLGTVGNYFAPTIFAEAGADMSVTRDEIFGPVLAVQTFDTAEEAIRLANDTNYGLSANVWTNDLGKAVQTIRAVRAGRTWINGAGTGGPEMGISGFRQSGMGRELGRHGFDEYSTLKNVYIVLDQGGSWI